MQAELLADDRVVGLRVAGGDVHDVHEDTRALDVAQEGVAQAGARAGALDEAGHVGDGRPAMVLGIDRLEVEDAEVRRQGREGVGRDLGIGRRQGREEGRLAGVGQADEPDVGDEPELEPQLAILARLALLGVARRAMGGRREVDVAQPAAPAAGDHHPLAGGDEVRDQVAAALVEDAGPRRHGQLELGRRPCHGAAIRCRGRRHRP